jgi:hypothetical protein
MQLKVYSETLLGLIASPSEAQARVVDKLWQKINAKVASKAKRDDDEEIINFDLKSKPRVLIYDAPLLKRCNHLFLVSLIYSFI